MKIFTRVNIYCTDLCLRFHMSWKSTNGVVYTYLPKIGNTISEDMTFIPCLVVNIFSTLCLEHNTTFFICLLPLAILLQTNLTAQHHYFPTMDMDSQQWGLMDWQACFWKVLRLVIIYRLWYSAHILTRQIQ